MALQEMVALGPCSWHLVGGCWLGILAGRYPEIDAFFVEIGAGKRRAGLAGGRCFGGWAQVGGALRRRGC